MNWLSRQRWSLVVAWIGLIMIATTIPVPSLPSAPRDTDKLAHFLLYAPLAMLLVRALNWEHRPRRLLFIILSAVVLSSVLGAFDEWHQQFVNRTTDVHDWLADTAGAGIGAIVAALGQSRKARRRDRG